MEKVGLTLPSELVQLADLEGDLSAGAARFVAMELYREGKITLPKAAQLCSTPLEEFRGFVSAHGLLPPEMVGESGVVSPCALYGLWSEFGPGPSAEEIDQNRAEMFGSFLHEVDHGIDAA